MLSIGLTGGIASGKSVVSERLAELGAVVVDHDELARAVLARGGVGVGAVRDRFGPGVFAADGVVDRPALAALVFADDAARADLEAIVHPAVHAAALAAQARAEASDAPVVVHDIPLLVETGQMHLFNEVLVVQAPVEVRVERLVRDRGMDASEARARIAAQATDEERRRAADVLLHNEGTVQELRARVDALWARWRADPRFGPAV